MGTAYKYVTLLINKYLFKARGKTTKGDKNREREKEGMHGKIGILW